MKAKLYTTLQVLRNSAASAHAGFRQCHWAIRLYDAGILLALVVSIGGKL